LDTATEVSFTSTPAIAALIKEKKKADLPNGLEAKDIGDTQVEATLTVPAELGPGTVIFKVVTPAGVTASPDLRVVAKESTVEEKEPNNGFHNAQSLELGKTVRGVIQADKDVDVFQFDGCVGQHLVAEVRASRLGSLLDSVLTLFDAHGNLITSNDDF